VFCHPDAATLTYLGLYAQQHRGQESAGIVTSNEAGHWVEIGMGLVADIFTEDRLNKLPGDMAIGHNRYSTSGKVFSKTPNPWPSITLTVPSRWPTTETWLTPIFCEPNWSKRDRFSDRPWTAR